MFRGNQVYTYYANIQYETIDLGALPNCPTRYATALQAPAAMNLAPNSVLALVYLAEREI